MSYQKQDLYDGLVTEQIAGHVKEILRLLGEDEQREGLLKTPERVAKSLQYLTKGYGEDGRQIIQSAMFDEEYQQMVLVKDIELYSTCEHHILPFIGKAHVAYIPNGKITGLSKIARVVETYAHFHGVPLQLIPAKNGTIDREALDKELAEGGVAGVIVQQPNYYGIVEDYTGIADAIHEQKGIFVVNANPSDLAILKTPGEWGADVAVGEGQSLGIPMTFGGPGVGFMACTEKLIRKMPGRIVGQTLDNRGQRAFVLTLQAREQHIRRQKATSNICSNQSLMALYVTIYLSLMGKEGLREVAEMSYANAHSLHDKLLATGKFKDTFPGQPFFNEFCVDYDGDIDALLAEATECGYLAGVKVGEKTLMLAVTEQRTPEEIEELCEILAKK